MENNVSSLQKCIDNKVKFVIMISLAVFGTIGSLTVLDEVRLSEDIESLENSVTALTTQVTELKVIQETASINRISINDLIALERHLMEEITEIRSEIERLK